MSDQLEDGSFINSIVGEGTTFKGELELSGLLRIDGDFIGTITTGGKVLVGKSGRAECTINAGTVVIGGIVKGNVYADEKVIVLSTGMMLGNINTPRLIAEEGVILNGSCLVRKEESIRRTARVEQFSLERSDRKFVAEFKKPGKPDKPDGDGMYDETANRELSSWKG